MEPDPYIQFLENWIPGIGEDTDLHALSENYVSIVPIQFDMTAHHLISNLNEWDQK